MKTTNIVCPLCGGDAPLRKSSEGLYYWSCRSCPFVGFEFTSENDSDRIPLALGEDLCHCPDRVHSALTKDWCDTCNEPFTIYGKV